MLLSTTMADTTQVSHTTDAVAHNSEGRVETPVTQIAHSSHGRVSGKGWKAQKTATKYVSDYSLALRLTNVAKRRSYLQRGVKAKSWEERMRKTATETAVKRLQKELIEEKAAEAAR